jgi:hypothetical protein
LAGQLQLSESAEQSLPIVDRVEKEDQVVFGAGNLQSLLEKSDDGEAHDAMLHLESIASNQNDASRKLELNEWRVGHRKLADAG